MDRTRLPHHHGRHRVEVAETIHEQRERFVEPQQVTAPEGAPNVLLIMLDDMGFGASSAFGGPCSMPVAEQLAADGLRLNRFHTTAICSPTRAALMTGRNHHSVGMGNLVNFATSVPGYDGRRGPDQATIAQILKHNGYATACFGKWHQTPDWEITPAGPFDRWPTGEGFEKFYGINAGESSQFTPTLYDGTTPVAPPATETEGYHLSEDLVDQAKQWLTSLRRASDKPWFTYLSFGATHAPFHLPESWRGRNRGKYAHGWNEQRRLTLERQKELGIVPADTELAPWTPGVPEWDDLSEVEKESAQLLMEAYDSFAEHTDTQVGRLVDFLRETGELDNTLVIYLLGDNGAAAEGGLAGGLNELLTFNGLAEDPARVVASADKIGGPETYPAYPVGWAVAMNAPFMYTKQIASHFGGTRNGAIIHWPERVADAGAVRDQFTHVIDVLPTVLDAIGLPEPEAVNGIIQQPLEGTSFIDVLSDGDAEDKHTTQYFEIFGSRAIYHEGWTAVAQHHLPWVLMTRTEGPKAFADDVWELYDTNVDFAQARNLAESHPEKLAELQQLFLEEARRYDVLPLDDRMFRPPAEGETGSPHLRSELGVTLTPADRFVTMRGVPAVASRSFRVTADFEADSDASNGVIVAQGGTVGGWSIHLVDGQLRYAHNRCGIDWSVVAADATVPAGRHTLDLLFRYDGGGFGLGAEVEFHVDGQPFGKGRVEQTVPFLFSTNETTNVGIDRGSPVAQDYAAGDGNPYSGIVHTVTIAPGDDALEVSPEDAARLELAGT
ncbi:arylsulfatase [Nocardioides alcanivorans]|uniref:arylsulfatase n=1 Tax=Nocardioides alcanivorans TaxID=2897352 RepID=UPI001F36D752|nr:arylsulfatase [Nocardioides alcanivorans]